MLFEGNGQKLVSSISNNPDPIHTPQLFDSAILQRKDTEINNKSFQNFDFFLKYNSDHGVISEKKRAMFGRKKEKKQTNTQKKQAEKEKEREKEIKPQLDEQEIQLNNPDFSVPLHTLSPSLYLLPSPSPIPHEEES